MNAYRVQERPLPGIACVSVGAAALPTLDSGVSDCFSCAGTPEPQRAGDSVGPLGGEGTRQPTTRAVDTVKHGESRFRMAPSGEGRNAGRPRTHRQAFKRLHMSPNEMTDHVPLS